MDQYICDLITQYCLRAHWVVEIAHLLNWLVSESQEYSCFYLPRTGITRACHSSPHTCVVKYLFNGAITPALPSEHFCRFVLSFFFFNISNTLLLKFTGLNSPLAQAILWEVHVPVQMTLPVIAYYWLSYVKHWRSWHFFLYFF